jgi:L-fuconolactonase
MSLNRRDFLAASAASALAVAGVRALAAADPTPGIIDTHTHFFDPTRKEGVPWPGKDDKALFRPVLPAEYKQLTAPLGVTGTVIVEASSWLEDNQWLLDLAKDDRFIVGIVGNLAPGTPDFVKHVERFAKYPKFRGIRVNHSAVKNGLGDKKFLSDIGKLADHNLELDINGGPDMLPDIARLAQAVGSLRIVINHVANVRIDGKAPPADWVRGMQDCAKLPHVNCKVSALVEGGRRDEGLSPADVAFYTPVLDTVYQLFGEDRLVYGSNWPVSVRFAPYAQVQKIVQEYFLAKGPAVSEKFFWKNALSAYQFVK